MSVRPRQLPRQLKPELEHDFARLPALGYEPPEEVGLIRCLSHGYPTPLARWHFHDEYELHLIVATSGKTFVGDWIGPFQPGHLVLCGPRLPHNWISTDVPGSSSIGHVLTIAIAASTRSTTAPRGPPRPMVTMVERKAPLSSRRRERASNSKPYPY